MKQERAVRTRQALIRAAAEAFEQHGYLQARLSDISSSAGVTPGALHFHFESKAAVAATVGESAATTLRRTARLSQRRHMNPLQRLTIASQALADRLRHDIVARAGYRLSCELPDLTGLDLRQEWQNCVQRLLAEADEEHLLATDITRQDMEISISAATVGLEVLGRTEQEWLSPTTLLSFWRFVLPRVATQEALATVDLESFTPPGETDADADAETVADLAGP